MTKNTHEMRLYDGDNQRLYLSEEERDRFILVSQSKSKKIRAFCHILLFTGVRFSEALSLKTSNVLLSPSFISVKCLKKRHRNVMREIPILLELAQELDDVFGIAIDHESGGHTYLFGTPSGPLHRVTAYRWGKEIMEEAGIVGAQATAKGLRHGYGIHAIRSGIQLHMLQKWMGHSNMATTAIYSTALGKEELELAQRMW